MSQAMTANSLTSTFVVQRCVWMNEQYYKMTAMMMMMIMMVLMMMVVKMMMMMMMIFAMMMMMTSIFCNRIRMRKDVLLPDC